jgi:hypothetical protein
LLLRRNKLHAFEKHILTFLKEFDKPRKNPQELIDGFIALKTNIEKATESKIEKNALSLFRFNILARKQN